MSETNPYATPNSDSFVNEEGYDQTRVFSMSQRIGRLRYLCYISCAYLIVGGIVGIVVGFMAAINGNEGFQGNNGVGIIVMIPLAILYIAFLVFSIIVGIRRLHDLNQSGWIIIALFIPIVGLFIAIYMLFFPGTQGSNKFGLQPMKNTPLIWVGGLILPLIFIIGILAAIALPAYQDYINRSNGVGFTIQTPISIQS